MPSFRSPRVKFKDGCLGEREKRDASSWRHVPKEAASALGHYPCLASAWTGYNECWAFVTNDTLLLRRRIKRNLAHFTRAWIARRI